MKKKMKMKTSGSVATKSDLKKFKKDDAKKDMKMIKTAMMKKKK